MLKRWQLAIIFTMFMLVSSISAYRFGSASLDSDEIFTIDYAKEINSLRYWEYFDHDLGNPPLFFFLLKPWLMISSNDSWLKTLPWLFYTISLIWTIKIFNLLKISSNTKTIFLIVMMGIGAYEYLSIYVRAYSLLLLLVVLSIYFTIKIISRPEIKYLPMLAITVWAGVHAHYVYWVFIAFWTATTFLVLIKNKLLTVNHKLLVGVTGKNVEVF